MYEEADIVAPAPETSRQAIARFVLGAALVLLALWTFANYLPALGWAGVIAIASWPFYKRMRARAGAGALAHAMPALFAIVIGLVFLAPVIGAGWFLSREAQAAVHWLDAARRNGVAPPDGLDKLKYIGPSLSAWWRDNLADPASAASLIRSFDKKPLIAMSEYIGAAAGRRLIVFLFTILALFFIYRDGDSLAAALGRLSERAFGPRGRAIGERIVVSVHGTVDGLVLVGLCEGLVLTIAYYFAGVPQIVLMGVATAIGCIIPFGAFLMFSTASLLLLYKGAIVAALVIFAFGFVVLAVADNIVRPFVIGNATRLPFLFVLIGILGGVESFGMLGLFLGLAIMAVLIDLWREATG